MYKNVCGLCNKIVHNCYISYEEHILCRKCAELHVPEEFEDGDPFEFEFEDELYEKAYLEDERYEYDQGDREYHRLKDEGYYG